MRCYLEVIDRKKKNMVVGREEATDFASAEDLSKALELDRSRFCVVIVMTKDIRPILSIQALLEKS